MKASGPKSNPTDRESNPELTAPNSRDFLSMARKKARVNSVGLTEHRTKAILSRIKYKDTEFIDGERNESTQVTGSTIKCMGKGSFNGRTGESMKVNILTIRNKDTGFLLGQVESGTKEFGETESNMARGSCIMKKGSHARESGRMERSLDIPFINNDYLYSISKGQTTFMENCLF